MEPFDNRLCGRKLKPIHSIFNSIPYALEQVKNGYDYIIRGKLIRQERYAGAVSRSFYVGENIEKEDVEAIYRHGVLTLTIPKKAEEKKIPEKNLIAIEG